MARSYGQRTRLAIEAPLRDGMMRREKLTEAIASEPAKGTVPKFRISAAGAPRHAHRQLDKRDANSRALA